MLGRTVLVLAEGSLRGLSLGRRHRCAQAEAATRLKNAYYVLSLQPGATKKDVKLAYYRLAKETHPDVLGGSAARKANEDVATGAANAIKVRSEETGFLDDDPNAAPSVRPFIEVQEAFDTLIEALENPDAFAAGEKKKKPAGATQRAKTLGEVLCDRLVDEPEAVEEIWGELMGQRVEVTGSMINLLLRACADGKGSDGFHTATALLEQGEAEGLFSLGARQSGICSLLNMCTGKMERNETWDADVVINHHIHDADREDPSVIAAIGAVYCAGTRSPF